MELNIVPVTILGGALAIFLGFRNNSAYDRWWEARKIWGGVVNYSRSWAMEVKTLIDDPKNKEVDVLVHRHIAYINALRMNLRDHMNVDELVTYLSNEEIQRLRGMKNVPTQINLLQSEHLKSIYNEGRISDFRLIELNSILKEFYNLQGKAERIKKTVFPYYYNYFTSMFLWVFIFMLPLALVDKMGVYTPFVNTALCFVFYILDQTGSVTEDPFENRAADIPLSSLCKTIEIDLKQMINDPNIPSPQAIEETKYGARFIK